MVLIALALIAAIWLFSLIVKKRRKFREFPEPPGGKLFGHIGNIRSTTDILKSLSKFIEQYGKTFRMRVGPSFAPFYNIIVTTDYKLTEHILTSNRILTKSQNYEYLKPWLGNGLLISDGLYWKRHRKLLTPTFHFEILKQFVETFEKVGYKLVQIFEKYDGVSSLDIHPLVSLCTLDIICETAMGSEINAQSGENVEYVGSVKEMCRIIIDRGLSLIKVFDITFRATNDYCIQKKALKILHGFTSDVINLKKGKQFLGKNKKMAFLDLLLKYNEEGEKMTDEELREEVDTFMFEGHDTTSSSICFTLYCLANNPEVQNKVLQEQIYLFGNGKNPTITYNELGNMKYLEHVIKESLRLYPAVPILGRYTNEDIEFDGHVIRKNSNLVIFVYDIHRNEEYFPEPDKFNPDRFNDIDGSLPYIYIPFSAGPRNCIGQKFAMLEMKSIISKIIRHFEIRPATPKHELKLSVEAVLKSVNGVKVGLQKRK